MDSFRLHIVTPRGDFYNDEIRSLNVRAYNGYLTILPSHIPLVTPIVPDIMKIETKDGKKELLSVASGILNVTKEETLLIVDAIEYKDQIDYDRAKRAYDRAKTRIDAKKADTDMLRAQAALKRAITRIKLYDMK